MITLNSFLLTLLPIFLLLNNAVFAVVYDDTTIQNAQLVSQDEDKVTVDKQVMIMADLSNGQDQDQKFAYIVQIRDENGVVISLSWITGSLTPGQSFSPALSWTPISAGTYTIQIFVWESVNTPDALSVPLLLSVDVVDN
ncbi:MAG: hypothetical protein IIA81_04715 [Thaumarchaeota archaeon]|nr:hypothetical protein [Nitrososphaerota archaeon]